MMEKRSVHIPTLMKIEITQTRSSRRRSDFHQNSCGRSTLANIVYQKVQAFGPAGSALNMVQISYRSPEYQARYHSHRYAYWTISPVARIILHTFSTCRVVMTCCRR